MAGPEDQFVADRLDVRRDGLEETGVRLGIQGAEGFVGLGGRGGGCLELVFGEQRVGGFELFVEWRG